MYHIVDENIRLTEAREDNSRERWVKLGIGITLSSLGFIALAAGAILYFE